MNASFLIPWLRYHRGHCKPFNKNFSTLVYFQMDIGRYRKFEYAPILVVSCGWSVIGHHSEFWRPEVKRLGNLLRNFCVFFVKTTSYEKIFREVLFRKFSPPRHGRCCVQISWNVGMLPTRNRRNHALFTRPKNNISPASQTVATKRIAAKICQGQPPAMYSQCSRYLPNRFTFGEVIAERVDMITSPNSL